MKKNWIRYIVFAVIGALIALFIDVIISFDQPDHNRLYDYIFSIILTIFICEGILFIDRKLNERISWLTHTFKRVIIQFPLSVTFSAITIYGVMKLYKSYVCVLPKDMELTLFKTSIIIGTLFSIIMLGVEISVLFLNQWKVSLAEVEKYKSESLLAQLQNLKNQVNPHFLFNNMSVLSSLVYKDQDKAVEFINQLSKVYRYLLDNKDTELVTLKTELEFIEAYTYLLQIRFDTNIKFKFNIDNKVHHFMMPPMAIQMLIENCIKHNEVSSDQPLTVTLSTFQGMLIVSNDIQARSVSESGLKTGLQNIQARYKYFTDIPVEIINNSKQFIVKIPLLRP